MDINQNKSFKAEIYNTDQQRRADQFGVYVKDNVNSIARYSCLAATVGLLFATLMAGSLPGTGIVAIAAMACFTTGLAFGFLFSIPKSAQNSDVIQRQFAESNPSYIPKDNTNLEQISDWLVKILIGASLVQLRQVAKIFESLAAKLSQCLLQTKHESLNVDATGLTPLTPYCQPFCLFLIIYFLILGFLTGYLVTRLWLPYVILMSGLAMKSAQKAEDQMQAVIKREVSDDITLLQETIVALREALKIAPQSTDNQALTRLAMKKAEECQEKFPANRMLGILYARLERTVNGYKKAIERLNLFISAWDQSHKPHDADYAALLFNLACYQNKRAEELDANNEKEAAEKLRQEAWEKLRESCKDDPQNVAEAKGDEDLKSLFNATIRNKEMLR
jgi:tetratricopeptide (TPR) repeat protein